MLNMVTFRALARTENRTGGIPGPLRRSSQNSHQIRRNRNLFMSWIGWKATVTVSVQRIYFVIYEKFIMV